jgi:polar amino acid transport system substrate-binding protein
MVLALGALLLLPVGAAGQATPGAAPARELLVGVKVTPPFVVKAQNGTWSGISIDLWRRVAEKLGVRYRFREYDLAGLLRGVERGEIDVVAAALTVTAAREQRMDFTHPFYSTGLGIAVPKSAGSAWLGVVERFFSWRFLKVVAGLAVVLLIAGALVWLFERRRNPQQFGGRPSHGLASGFWWSAVTMTTVGYGDKAPVTPGGRTVALFWMFTSIIIISGFTAAIASSLTVSSLESPVRGPADLPSVRVASVPGSTSAHYLQRNGVGFQRYARPADTLAAVARKRADAAVYDAPILRHIVKTAFQGRLTVLSRTFQRQDYAFALRADSPLREPINRALLQQIASPWWRQLLKRHLGE